MKVECGCGLVVLSPIVPFSLLTVISQYLYAPVLGKIQLIQRTHVIETTIVQSFTHPLTFTAVSIGLLELLLDPMPPFELHCSGFNCHQWRFSFQVDRWESISPNKTSPFYTRSWISKEHTAATTGTGLTADFSFPKLLAEREREQTE